MTSRRPGSFRVWTRPESGPADIKARQGGDALRPGCQLRRLLPSRRFVTPGQRRRGSNFSRLAGIVGDDGYTSRPSGPELVVGEDPALPKHGSYPLARQPSRGNHVTHPGAAFCVGHDGVSELVAGFP